MKAIKFFCLAAILSSYFPCISQILTIDSELYRDTTSKKKYGASINLAFSTSKQRKNLLDFTSKLELDRYLKNKYSLIFLCRTDATYNGKTVLQNNGYFQFRYRDQDTRKVSIDPALQGQWNGVQGMEYRFLAAMNVRFRWLEKSKSDLYSGVGVFYELEKWNPLLAGYAFSPGDSTTIIRKLPRLNLTSKFALKVWEGVTLTGMTFVQFPINNHFTTPRWVLDTQFLFHVNKHLSITLSYSHNYDLYRPLPIDAYYYATSTGIRLNY